MTADDMDEWMDKICLESFAAKVFLRELFSKFYPNCNCRVNGKLVVPGRVNTCTTCYRHVASLDAHVHRDDFDLAIVSWLSLIWRGKEHTSPCSHAINLL